jgi:hypothetical protein
VQEDKAEEDDDEAEQVNIVLEAMERSGEQMNTVAATNAKLEATIAEMTKQISKLTEMNSNLVKALIAVGGKVADKNNADKVAEQDKENNANKRPRGNQGNRKECSYCKKTHPNAGKFCLARKCNTHLRPNNWKGTEIDE